MKTYSDSLGALLLASLFAFTFAGCQSPTSKPTTPRNAPFNSEEAEANLTRSENDRRKALVSDVSYDFDAQLDAVSETFKASSTATFTLAKRESVFLDYANGAQITSVVANEQPLKYIYKHHRLDLPASALQVGVNRVVVSYAQTYSHDGRGLHRFVDPEDENVYLYSQFETYDAHQMFPCFDQPDLKATMAMRITAPAKWQVITTTRESTTENQGENKVWTFPATPKISTYLFSLHAGPYSKWEDRAGSIPLRLFARKTLAKYIDKNEWFIPTQEGLAFYGHYFHYPYPFKKFDEIIAPDFNAGAMENVAAITFSEHFVRRGPTTREEREGTASVILHEMAHMWFGDLVTMEWWNGLWLNESFATFMSSYSQFNATEFKESWITFYRHEKLWAYLQDELVTTHPIEATIADVATAFTNFDGITYGKGASVLKQLNFYLGADQFRRGVRGYFKDHAYSNTTLHDFIGSLEKVSGKDLKSWSHAWLEEAGLDSVEAVYLCKSNRVSSFALKALGPFGKETPRVHKTRVRLFSFIGASLLSGRSADLEYHNGLTEVAAFNGAPCPSFVDPNDDDQDYVKVKFDARSLATIQKSAVAIRTPFTRIRIWPTLNQMVRDQELAPAVYLKVAQAAIPGEQHLASLEQLTDPLAQMFYYLPIATSVQRATRANWVQTFESLLYKRSTSSPAGSDFQKTMFMKFVWIAESQAARDHIFNLLTGTETLSGLTLDADRRWAMLVRLESLGDQRALALTELESKSDVSERGIEMKLAAEAARPNIKAKRKWFEELLNNGELKFARARPALQWMFPPLQDDLRSQFEAEYFSSLPDFARRRQIDMVELFTARFVPAVCSAESAKKIKSFLDTHKELPPTVVKQLLMDHQEDIRCAAIRSRADS